MTYTRDDIKEHVAWLDRQARRQREALELILSAGFKVRRVSDYPEYKAARIIEQLLKELGE